MATVQSVTRSPLIAIGALMALVLMLFLVLGIQTLVLGSERSLSKDTIAAPLNTSLAATNYQPVLAEGVQWAALNEHERVSTARYAVKAAIERARADEAASFNVLGTTSAQEPIFFYTGGELITLIVEGTPVQIALDE